MIRALLRTLAELLELLPRRSDTAAFVDAEFDAKFRRERMGRLAVRQRT